MPIKVFISVSIIAIIVNSLSTLIDYAHDIEFIAIQGFEACDEDGDNGVTWKEVSDCSVSHFNHLIQTPVLYTVSLCITLRIKT